MFCECHLILLSVKVVKRNLLLVYSGLQTIIILGRISQTGLDLETTTPSPEQQNQRKWYS